MTRKLFNWVNFKLLSNGEGEYKTPSSKQAAQVSEEVTKCNELTSFPKPSSLIVSLFTMGSWTLMGHQTPHKEP